MPGLQKAQVSFFTSSSTSATWPLTLTARHSFITFPDLSIRKVLRSTPMYWRPYIDFIFMTSNALQVFSSGSDSSSNGKDCFSLKFSWDLIESLETPMISVFAFRKDL